MGRILVIDDDLSLREVMEMLLSNLGHSVDLAEDGQAGLSKALAESYDLVISDIRMPGLTGLEVLEKLRAENRQTTLLLVSAYATDKTAVEAMRLGAYDFIPKPFRPGDLISAVDSALAHHNVDKERQALNSLVVNNQRFGGLVGSSPAMLQVYDLVKRAASTSTSILITGESGTGKELVARAVHSNSSRAEKNFVAINCGGMPEHLVESELFGHKKGAFTGAHVDKQGLMSTADGGTLFLDELAELTLPMQVKLLRVVQEKSFRPVGGNAEVAADVRFIAATNKSLEAEIIAGRFREDLYYRLNVINIRIPPLRERTMDIPLLAQYFLEKYSAQQQKDVRKLSTYALDILSRYHFPGNVRELENIIERSVALEQSNIILPDSLQLADFKRQSSLGAPPLPPDGLPGWRIPDAAPPGGLPETFPPQKPPARADQQGQDEARPRPPAALDFKSLQLVPGGLDDILTSLEGYYLYNALMTAGGNRSRTSNLVGISPWRLRMRLLGFNLADLNPVELMSISKDKFPKPALPPSIAPDWTGGSVRLDDILHAVERQFIKLALDNSNANKTEAANALGLSRRSFQHRIERTNYEALKDSPELSAELEPPPGGDDDYAYGDGED
ncbi:MAG: sigma 54-interacting transcriptional regulator [Deltaproteobacteria bacterium]|nr:sigma 54-interacting transcriptional regulator [Deltaproteobacteria bacterium]